jgi:sporulation protein YunB
MFRFRVRRKQKIVLFTVLIFSLLAITVWLVDRNLHPILIHIARTEVKKVAQQAILEGISEQLKLSGQLNQVMKIQKDKEGNISYIETNPQVQAMIYQKTTAKIQEVLKHLKDKPIQISLGQAIDSSLFANYGPPLSIDIWPKGSVKVSIVPKLESQGINMVMVTMMLKIHTEMGLVIPFTDDFIPVDVDYPIAQALVVGKVPNYYFYNDRGQVKQVPMIPIK